MSSRVIARRAAGLAFLCLAGEIASPAWAASVDESALRYYAATGQASRVERETRRLRALDPSWQQPDDLALEDLGRPDEAQLWDLFAADRLDDLAHAIADRKARQPGWQPSPNLSAKFDRKRLRVEVLREATAGRWDEVAARAASIKADARDPEIAWTVAEGLIRTRHDADGLAILRGLLATSDDAGVRMATLQKGLTLLGLEAAETLIAQGRVGPNGQNEWRPAALDITRARIAGFLRRERSSEVPTADTEDLARFVRDTRDGGGAALLGWYAFNRDDDRAALEWFKIAIAAGGDAMAAHGLAHTLRRLGYLRDAEDVAYAWRQPLVQNTILFTDIVEAQLTAAKPILIEPERLERYGRVVTDTQSGEGAQALAWYAFNLCQYDVALNWFERAVAWFPKEATVLGYAVTLRRLGRQRDFLTVVNRYDGLFPRVVDLVFRDSTGERQACEGGPVDAARPGARLADVARFAVPVPVPLPGGARAEGGVDGRKPGFPLPVWEENPRRVLGDKAVALDTPGEARGARPPLVARRVLGVTAMPYEVSGATLMPAFDGSNAPASVGSNEWPAPRGTVWARDEAKPSVDRNLVGLNRPASPTIRANAFPLAVAATGRVP